MEVTPEQATVGTIISGLIGIFTAGKLRVWVFGHQYADLQLSHERERKQWELQLEQVRDELRKAEAREKTLWDLTFERRDVISRAVDVAVNSKAA